MNKKMMQADIGKRHRLFLDDVRTPTSSNYAVVRSYDDAVHYIRSMGMPNHISFDHDLGDAETHTGLDVAKWIVERDMDDNGTFIPADFTFNVHSANPPGKKNIEGLLNNYLEFRKNNQNN